LTETEKVAEWIHFYKASPKGYQANALRAILKNDGEKLLNRVLRELKLEKTVDLLNEMGDW
jgi:hypothetical protein